MGAPSTERALGPQGWVSSAGLMVVGLVSQPPPALVSVDEIEIDMIGSE